ncbi:ATP-binding protein [Alcaligenaceae bacterium C4P045]|nr:ATP-binding protein [Alcaligenaceae bacterium C4P045]
MTAFPVRPDESERLEDLLRTGILDTPGDPAFDRITRIAAQITGAPIALVSLLTATHQWFKSHHGLDVTSTPREWAFCNYAVLQDDVFTVEDATQDPRFMDNPLVLGDPHIRFYSGVPLVGAQGRPLGTLCVIDRESRALSPAQREALRDLALIVADTIELRVTGTRLSNELAERQRAQAELRRARDAAVTQIQAHANFIATLTHEVRVVLQGINGLIAMFESADGAERAQSLAAAMRFSTDHLLRILNDTLDVSSLEAGAMTLKVLPFDLAALVNSAAGLFTSQAQAKKLYLNVEGADVPLILNGDAVRIQQILFNLINNAVKFTRAGGIVVSIGAARRTGAITTLDIVVRDTGPGLSETAEQNLFRPFSSAALGASETIRGTGLGLAICLRLARLMGGAIRAETQRGVGTAFIFSLVCRQTPAMEDLPRLAAADDVVAPVTPLRVLVADDDPTCRLSVSWMLERAGHSVDTVDDGEAAVRRATLGNYDLIFMDRRMGHIDGESAARTIRGKLGARAPYIVALTGEFAPLVDGEESPFSGFVEKPATATRLAHVTAAVVQRRKRRDPGSQE